MISVIVPIYNVESYLSKCLDSLEKQTFPDVEFILVDDGSTDRSGEIADKYNDPRFRVFHMNNHGLSAARNFGIDNARGEWLMFVDGDDWVMPSFCETPYNMAMSTNADIVIFDSFHQRHGRNRITNHTNRPTGIVTADVAVEFGYYAAWNKLYRRELFDSIRYPQGRVYEDIATTHKLIYAANRITFIPDCLYCYVMRKGSISHTYSYQNRKDCFLASRQRYEYLLGKGYPPDKLKNSLLTSSITLIASDCPKEDPEFQRARDILNSTEGIPSFLNWKKKIALLAWKLSKPMFCLLCRLTGRMKWNRREN